jgi:hypothetical protein
LIPRQDDAPEKKTGACYIFSMKYDMTESIPTTRPKRIDAKHSDSVIPA